MEKYYLRKSLSQPSLKKIKYSSNQDVEFNLQDLPTDPGLRIPISCYIPNIQDQVRRAYLQRGPVQSKNHNFKLSDFGNQKWRFGSNWFGKFGSWLEYNIEKDVAFCLFCYLFKEEIGNKGSGDSFVGKGFRNWRKPEKFIEHMGDVDSAHNKAREKCEMLMNQNQHIRTAYARHSDKHRSNYRAHMIVGMAISGSESGFGNINVVTFDNAPGNLQMTSNEIKKDIVSCAVIENTNIIINEMGDVLFSLLIDKSRIISAEEQMAVVLRYVDKNGYAVERFIGIEHVTSTTSISLKEALDRLFSRHGLSMFRLRGQGYDGASNMQGEFNGLKALILEDNKCAYFIHCFAHQFQLALISAVMLLKCIQSFDFVFNLLLMKKILGFAHELSQALRQKDQDIADAIKLIGVYKRNLQKMRENGLDSLLSGTSSYCVKHDIDVPNMDDLFQTQGRSQRKAQKTNIELLLCVVCLCPNDSFAGFDKQKLLRLTEFYPNDFFLVDLVALETQLDVYIMDVSSDKNFSGIKGIGELARKLVETKKDKLYSLVYLLMTLPFILLVATTTVERAFSDMNFVKNRLRNWMRDQ
ncbi:hypothetical protein CISIN_1g038809mg [Citrus sinensis]|uniref:TTF-type domain-containing protein n=1 Tax=Citrus sinensis TaxID=2711 RepID=A0A067DNN8_CITSI|nr:hypothetical protein CISIN_1g038809mg [Citrus sinensis]